MRFKISFGEKKYNIEIEELEGATKVKIDEKEFFFDDKEKNILPETFFEKRNFVKKEIVAPIGGTISEIFVKEGDLIEKNQKILILSAMKMENEIVAEFKGKIKKIFVKKGQTVKKEEPLLILE